MTPELVDAQKTEVRRWIQDARDAALKLPRGRESALVLTKLDEASHWVAAVPIQDGKP